MTHVKFIQNKTLTYKKKGLGNESRIPSQKLNSPVKGIRVNLYQLQMKSQGLRWEDKNTTLLNGLLSSAQKRDVQDDEMVG